MHLKTDTTHVGYSTEARSRVQNRRNYLQYAFCREYTDIERKIRKFASKQQNEAIIIASITKTCRKISKSVDIWHECNFWKAAYA